MNGIIDFKNCNRKTFLLKGMVELLLSSIQVFSYEQNIKLSLFLTKCLCTGIHKILLMLWKIPRQHFSRLLSVLALFYMKAREGRGKKNKLIKRF